MYRHIKPMISMSNKGVSIRDQNSKIKLLMNRPMKMTSRTIWVESTRSISGDPFTSCSHVDSISHLPSSHFFTKHQCSSVLSSPCWAIENETPAVFHKISPAVGGALNKSYHVQVTS
ncbi:uncharacterized protein LOC113467597 [Diaphorina citri]|uniref:Uncharacterized protein LOC113467597 n=1 Tax=Diaphorina citri TaxID=121845 RepID=A0A3Q0ITS2_DIACI|nr:uncharacterized protein LOC113467597 [Diaphorina citri]